jgi:DNA-binding NarL/FixJ family response regulator
MLAEDRYALGRDEVVVKSSRTGMEAPGLTTALGSSAGWVDGRTEVLEREGELERIAAALGAAVDGSGSVLLVEGPAGIGKTTLGLAAADEARSRGMRVLRAAGRELERDFSYGVVRQLLDPVLRAAAPADRGRWLDGAGTASVALRLVPGHAAPSEFAVLHGLYWLVANLSDERPTLIVVDDAQWGDVASLRFLSFLTPRLVDLPVLLFLCARPDEWEPGTLFAGTSSDVASRPLMPSPLTREACAGLVRARLGGSVDDALCAACHAATGGNPFLLRALLDELADDRVGSGPASAGRVLAMGPRVVTRAIVTRLDRLSRNARPLAAALAVLGDGASAEELGALAGLSASAVRRAAGELARVSIVTAEEGFRFAHPIVRNAVYADLSPEEHDRLHRSAAGVLEAAEAPAERVAAQLLAVDPAGDRRVCVTLRRAAEIARASGASHSAVAYLRRALAEPCPEDQRAELLVELGEAEYLVDARAALEHLQEALALTIDPRRYAQIATRLGWLLTLSGSAQAAAATAEHALTRLGDRDADLRRSLQATILTAGHHDPSLASVCEPVAAQVREAELDDSLGARRIQALLLSDAYRGNGSARELAAGAERLLADGLLLREDNGYAGFMLPVRVLIEADSEQAIVWLDRAQEHARATGSVQGLYADLMFSCLAHLRRGELADAIQHGVESIEGMELWGGGQIGRVTRAGWLAVAQIEAGDLDGAGRTLARSAPPDGEAPDLIGWHRFTFMSARASLLLSRGDPRGSLQVILEAAHRFEPRSLRWLGWRSHAAQCLTLLGDEPELAVKLVEADVDLARGWGAPGALGVALRTRGLVLGDQDGEDSLREAVAVLDGSICKLEHARALVELGAMLRRTARRREARGSLRSGLELARTCGAAYLAIQGEEELRAAGASPRDVIRVGVDELTASERRVAQLAASGRTNKQIAQTLFVTVKTVETHLHRTYQKLDVSSRAQLAQALEPVP